MVALEIDPEALIEPLDARNNRESGANGSQPLHHQLPVGIRSEELIKRLRHNVLQVPVQIFSNDEFSRRQHHFLMRLIYLDLDETLLDAHMRIFKRMRPLFTIFYEALEGKHEHLQRIL